MKLEEIVNLEGLGFTFDKDDILLGTYLHKNDFHELIETVWNLAIDTAADNADADVNWLDEHLLELTPGKDFEVYVLKNSILKFKV